MAEYRWERREKKLRKRRRSMVIDGQATKTVLANLALKSPAAKVRRRRRGR